MTPIRMSYFDSIEDKEFMIDVYHFHQLEDTLDVLVTGWLVESECWITVPIFMITPIVKKQKKKALNESEKKHND